MEGRIKMGSRVEKRVSEGWKGGFGFCHKPVKDFEQDSAIISEHDSGCGLKDRLQEGKRTWGEQGPLGEADSATGGRWR